MRQQWQCVYVCGAAFVAVMRVVCMVSGCTGSSAQAAWVWSVDRAGRQAGSIV